MQDRTPNDVTNKDRVASATLADEYLTKSFWDKHVLSELHKRVMTSDVKNVFLPLFFLPRFFVFFFSCCFFMHSYLISLNKFVFNIKLGK